MYSIPALRTRPWCWRLGSASELLEAACFAGQPAVNNHTHGALPEEKVWGCREQARKASPWLVTAPCNRRHRQVFDRDRVMLGSVLGGLSRLIPLDLTGVRTPRN
jgi:hypothetical protein